jgi:hypothetical protein
MSFPQVTMPGRSTQQNLRNFVLRLEPLALVNAELLFGNIKDWAEADTLRSFVNGGFGSKSDFTIHGGSASGAKRTFALKFLWPTLGTTCGPAWRPVALVAGFVAFAGAAFLPTLR